MSKSNEKKDKIIEIPDEHFTASMKDSYNDVIKQSKQLLQLYNSLDSKIKDKEPLPQDPLDLFLEWAEHQQEFHDDDMHNKLFPADMILPQENLKTAKSKESFLKSLPIKTIHYKNLRFSKKFLRKLKETKHDVKMFIIAQIYSVIDLTKLDTVTIKGLSNMQFYMIKVSITGKTLVLAKHMERIPHLDEHKKQVTSYQYFEVVRYLDIVNEKTRPTEVCINFIEECKNDPDRQERDSNATYKYENESYWNYVSPEDANEISYDRNLNRWVSKSYQALYASSKHQAAISKINANILDQFADFDSASKLVQLLEKIPNFKMRLTEEERRIIGQAGNVLAIGRSGTGKTTCAVLRLFAQDMLFKIRQTQAKINEGLLIDKRFDFAHSIGIHSAFVTASPVLSNEVGRYYQKLNEKVKDELERRKSGNKKTMDETLTDFEILEITEDKIEEISLLDNKTETQEEGEHSEKEEDEDEEAYLIDEDEIEGNSGFNQINSLKNVEEKDFPLFLTTKKLVLLIDSTLDYPFFARADDNSLIGFNNKAQWHNEMKGVMMINDKHKDTTDQEEDDNITQNEESKGNTSIVSEMKDWNFANMSEEEIQAEYQKYMAVLKHKNQQEALKRKANKVKFEIDFDYFLTHYWEGIVKKRLFNIDLSPITVWGEIMSYIKGSAESHLEPCFILSREQYVTMGEDRKTLLSKYQRNRIYAFFEEYEGWKKDQGGYDFMDVVNHVLNEIKLRGYHGAPIHFLMIDEVQDLPHATILLLMKTTEQGVFFAGDTAQTIAKGVGVKFSDLAYLFKQGSENELVYRKPKLQQLTVNFRSHGKILDLANSVVNLIENFFPRTIDKLRKEKSEIDGPKPILLQDVDIGVLFAVLFGAQHYKHMKEIGNQTGFLQKPPIEFGCNQVIIVRDQESKEKLPPILKHALCLTVYEAKGLEFDHVILYNFFTDSLASSEEWGLLNFLEIENKSLDKESYDKLFFTYREEGMKELSNQEEQAKKQISLDDVSIFSSKSTQDETKYNIKRVSLPKNAPIKDISNYSMLCNELKQLYVALTRPRSRIIIYDENIKNRETIEEYWKKLDLVEVITKKQLESSTQASQQNKDIASFKALISATTPSEWKKQGLRMFRNKYYEQAYKCFEKSEHSDLKLRAEAYMIADRASQKLKKINNERTYLSEGVQQYANLKLTERKRHIAKLKEEERACYTDFEQAANIFSTIGLKKQAGQCYFSAGMYIQALKAYQEIELYREAGEAYYMMKDYKNAGDMFRKGGDFVKAIECYEICMEFEKIVQVIRESKQIPSRDREHYAKKCANLAIKQLMDRIDGKFKEEMKEKIEKQFEDAFRERSGSEDSQEDENQVELEVPDLQSELTSSKHEGSELSFIEVSETGHKDVYELTLDGSSNLGSSHVTPSKAKMSKRISELSFNTPNKHDDSFEHLSVYSIEDEFLKSKEGSVFESLNSARKRKSQSFSDFSVMERKYAPAEEEYNIIQTKACITIQDDVLQRIVEYTSLPLELADQEFATNVGDDGKVQLENLTLNHLNLILDFLDHGGFYKLCILICNRYNLNQKIGQYLVNLAYGYSYFAREDIKVSLDKLSTHNRILQQDKAYVASTAINHIFELINPDYLKLKKRGEKTDEDNSLGYECYSQMISLGLWKKCLFIMNFDSSLALASAFASFKNYKLIYLMSINGESQEHEKLSNIDFEFLPFAEPTNKDEVRLSMIALDAVAWDILDKMPIYLSKRYHGYVDPNKQLSVPEKFPSYFSFNEALWKFIIQKKPEQSELLIKSYPDAIKYVQLAIEGKLEHNSLNEVQLYDAITFIFYSFILHKENPIKEQINVNSTLQTIQDLAVLLKDVITHIEKISKPTKFEEIIIKALLTPFRIRYVEDEPELKTIGPHYFIAHISSPLLDELIEPKSSVYCDVEGSFIMTPHSVCLGAIKKKIVQVIGAIVETKVIKVLTRAKKASPLIDINGSAEHYKVLISQRAKLLTLIRLLKEIYKAVYGKDPEELSNSEEETAADKEVEEASKYDVYEKQVQLKLKAQKASYKPKKGKDSEESKQIEKSSKTKAKKKETHGPSVFRLKKEIVKELATLLQNVITTTTIKLDIYSREELMTYAIIKAESSIRKGKIRPYVVHIFHLLGKEIILTELIRKYKDYFTASIRSLEKQANQTNQIAVNEQVTLLKKKVKALTNLQLYHDAIYYKRYNCAEEYVTCVFDYLPYAKSRITIAEIIYQLYSVTPYIVGATLLGKQEQEIFVPETLDRYLEGVQLIKAENDYYEWKRDILPFETNNFLNELVQHTFELVQRIFNEGESLDYAKQLLKILLIIVANFYDLEPSAWLNIKSAIDYILDILHHDREFDYLSGCFAEINSSLFYKGVEEAVSQSPGSSFNFKGVKYLRVILSSDQEAAKKNNEKSDRAWNLEMREIALRMRLKKKLKRVYFKREKKISRVLQNPFASNYNLALMMNWINLKNSQALKPRFNELYESHSKALKSLEFAHKTLINHIAQSQIPHPADYHYLQSLLERLVASGDSFISMITQSLADKEAAKKIEKGEVYSEFINEIDNVLTDFNNFKNKVTEKESSNPEAKKKAIQAKWQEEEFMQKLQELIRKRKGFIKEKYLQVKKYGKRVKNHNSAKKK